MEDHPQLLIEVGAEAHTVKEERKYVQVRLEAGRSWGTQEPVICVKELFDPLYDLYKTTWAGLLPCG